MPHDHPPLPAEASTRERILTAAGEEFIAHGCEGARIQRIAERSGANKAMIYYYFGSKDNLYRQALGAVVRETFAKLMGVVASAGSLEQKLSALVRVYVDLYGREPGFVRLLLRELAAERSILREVLQELLGSLEGAGMPSALLRSLEEERQRGAIRGEIDPRHLLVSMVGMSAAAFIFQPVMRAILSLDDRQYERFAAERPEQVTELLLHGILKGGRS